MNNKGVSFFLLTLYTGELLRLVYLYALAKPRSRPSVSITDSRALGPVVQSWISANPGFILNN
jgi:hypothetical protein